MIALPLFSLLTFLVLLALPPPSFLNRLVRRILCFESAILILYCSADVALFFLAWVASLIPLLRASGDGGKSVTWRVLALYLLGGVLPLAVGLGLIFRAGLLAGLPAPFHLPDLVNSTAVLSGGHLAFVLLLVAAGIRKGLLPFQSWVPLFFEEVGLGLASLEFAAQAGAALLARVALPLFSSVALHDLLFLDVFGMATAIYAAVLASHQWRPRRVLAWFTLSQSALLMVGLISHDSQGASGSLVQWVALGLSTVGLCLTLWLAESRVGRGDMCRYGGVAKGAPVLAGAFVFFVFASVGIPGTLGFVGEDLLIHGILSCSRLLGVVFLLVTALNGVTAFRLFSRVFLGASPGVPVAPLRASERAATGILVLLLVGFGLLPGGLLQLGFQTAVSFGISP
jgi:NADH-quinone oxidoreductase subunit M